MKKIIYTRPDGGVSVVHPMSKESVGKLEPKVLGMSDAEYIDWIKNKDVPADATNIMVVDESELPKDRSNRDKWVIKSGKIEVDATIKTKGEKKKEKVDSAKADMTKLGLGKDTIDLLLRPE